MSERQKSSQKSSTEKLFCDSNNLPSHLLFSLVLIFSSDAGKENLTSSLASFLFVIVGCGCFWCCEIYLCTESKPNEALTV
eukprot:Pgem_evm1s7123